MMCDTNWCTFCDNAISPYSNSLYCSEECLRQDALMHHPMLGYDYAELKGFPHQCNETMPSLVRRKLSIPSLSQESSQKIPSLSPSLSSSISSCASNDHHKTMDLLLHPKPRKFSPTASFMEQLNQAF
ncbi:uncharacterized protein B0P05DRAFT_146810 [Gilbertella persicaria]|uniref:uncharacterized protein n=1 Tax=Gilbertella persicaria TaxID=101096 RepID=UPI0022208460|nr:uncharacterized protein B0P05DRAFT_146810 [Gilbertella persicaria]KAI8075882.1 hypothetical protein B0P05DRAFT_146810 [Gilbertella persicaria]